MATESLKVGRAWDATFYEWTNDLELGKKLVKPKRAPVSKSMWTGAVSKAATPASYSNKGSKADVRGRLAGVAQKSTQVMVKITPGKNKTMRAVREHLMYIAREDDQAVEERNGAATGGEVLHDQDGKEITGKEAIEALGWAWKHTGPQLPEHSDTKLAFNIMFSMPEGTDPKALYGAVRAAAGVEFAGYQWVMVQHFDEPQVHCHVCVKAEGMDGVRLNPRKADLQRWRERFAFELRERGVEAEATRRASRMHQQRITKPWAVTRLEERGQATNAQPSEIASSEKIRKWKTTENRAASSYDRIIQALHRSDEAADRILAKQLQESSVGARARAITEQSGKPKRDLERT